MRRLLLRIRNIFWRDAPERELARELESHLLLLEDEFQRCGMSPGEARSAARRSLGGIELAKERHRDARSLVWVEDARRDFGHAMRSLRRRPIVTATAVLSLAIGIGANTAIFTVVNALLFRAPAGVVRPERLVDIGVARDDGGLGNVSYPTFLDIGRRMTLVEDIYAHPMFPRAMSLGIGNTPGAERVFGQLVTPNYFAVLGVAPALGRWFDGDRSARAGPVVVLAHRFWTRRFDRDPAIVGRTIQLNGRPFTIVGVAAEGFQGNGYTTTDLWLPLDMASGGSADDGAFTNRFGAWLALGGRLEPGVSTAQAASEIDAIGQALEREYPNPGGARGLRLLPSSRVGGNSRVIGVFVALLMTIVALVLVVACANVGGILLAQAAARRQEIAVRTAMGAPRGRVFRQLMTETIALFAIGGSAGLVLARVLTSAVVPLLPSLPFPVSVALPLDMRVVAFTLGVSLVTAIVFGLAPALQASRVDVVTALKDASQGWAGRARLRSLFVVAQVAFSLVLVVVAGLFIRALQQAVSSDPGFNPHGVELATLNLSIADYTEASGARFTRELVERVRRLPAVQAASIAQVAPGGFEGIGLGGVTAPGFTPPNGQRFLFPAWNVVGPGYFATLQIPIVAGREFTDTDGPGAQQVAIVGESLARRLWPGQPAVGQVLSHGVVEPGGKSHIVPLLVVGVARDVKTSSLIDGLAESFVYLPMDQHYSPNVILAARSVRGARLADDIRSAVSALNPMLPIVNSQTLEESTELGLVPQRVAGSLAGSLGLVGLVLAAIGIYGVMAYVVARRTREFGIRLALGAPRGAIVGMILRQGIGMAALGGALGLVLAAGAARVLAAFFFGHPPFDPLVFGGAAALFTIVALAACLGPSRRALGIDPVNVLRDE